ncbi:MAG: membrane protein insertase YidC [Candidatus Omnitrophota bacterium]|jgi:YidC/Oxa1 family membrane protein insertase
MEKRLIIAIALSMLVLLAWSALAPKPQPASPALPASPAAPSEKRQSVPLPQEIECEPAPEEVFSYQRDKTELTFIVPLAVLKEARFKDYQSYLFPLKQGFWLEDKGLVFRKASAPPGEVIFIYQDKEKEIIKRFIFSNSNYSMELEIETRNLSDSTISPSLPLVLGVLDFSGGQNQARFQDITAALKDKTLHLNGRKDMQLEGVQFIGIRDRYFCLIVEPSVESRAFIQKLNSHQAIIGLNIENHSLAPGSKDLQKFHIYLGPQDLQLINPIKSSWAQVVHYGTFDFIAHLLLQLLRVAYRLVHNWGLAIIILSLAIYFLLYPFTLKQMRSMKEMQALQPHIEELRKTYKDNPQKMNKEIMELYREHKVNPFGGCLPLILQMPIFFALYQALLRSVSLKGASFLWIRDLSEPDRLFLLPVSLPVLGNEINLLPIVMAVGMFLQQKMSLKSAGSGSAEQQRLMMIILPLMFGLIFYHMPAGLVLYWLVNSVLMLISQFKTSRAR